MPRPSKYSFIDLFAGCGGFSLGLVQAKLNGILAVEKAQDAFETFSANFLHGPADWRFDRWPEWLPKQPLDIKQFVRDFGQTISAQLAGNVALIAGGPPCQGFSMAGRRNAADPRNQLFRSYVDVVRLVQPEMVVLENVPGMAMAHGKESAGVNPVVTRPRHTFSDRLVKELGGIGYVADYEVMMARDFGVPQVRPRLFVIGIRKDIACRFDDPVRVVFDLIAASRSEMLASLGLMAPVASGDALSDLKLHRGPGRRREQPRTIPCIDPFSPAGFEEIDYRDPPSLTAYQQLMRDSMNGGSSANSLRLARHRPHVRDRFETIQALPLPKGVSVPNWVRDELSLRKHRICVIDETRPAPTLTTLPDDLLHYDEPRILTVRETARLQSFPDRFAFRGKFTTGGDRRKLECPRYTQVGNAVPPLVARAIGMAIVEFLEAAQSGSGGRRGTASRRGQRAFALEEQP